MDSDEALSDRTLPRHLHGRYAQKVETGLCRSLLRSGLCVDEASREERPGSALLAARREAFDALFLNDVSAEAVAALRQRVGGEDTRKVRLTALDCNEAAVAAREHLFPPTSASGTLGLAVIDPTAFQVSFDAIREMTADLRVDLIITFMTGYILRFIGEPSLEGRLDRFFGTPEWRDLIPGIHRGRLTYRALLDLYEAQLRSIGYSVFDDRQQARNRAGASIYHMVFASKDPRGGDFWRKISQRDDVGRARLPGDLATPAPASAPARRRARRGRESPSRRGGRRLRGRGRW